MKNLEKNLQKAYENIINSPEGRLLSEEDQKEVAQMLKRMGNIIATGNLKAWNKLMALIEKDADIFLKEIDTANKVSKILNQIKNL